MGVTKLAAALKKAMVERIEEEGRAKRGTVQNGQVLINARQYNFAQAVDCNVTTGRRVWALRTIYGKAVIVGA